MIQTLPLLLSASSPSLYMRVTLLSSPVTVLIRIRWKEAKRERRERITTGASKGSQPYGPSSSTLKLSVSFPSPAARPSHSHVHLIVFIWAKVNAEPLSKLFPRVCLFELSLSTGHRQHVNVGPQMALVYDHGMKQQGVIKIYLGVWMTLGLYLSYSDWAYDNPNSKTGRTL